MGLTQSTKWDWKVLDWNEKLAIQGFPIIGIISTKGTQGCSILPESDLDLISQVILLSSHPIVKSRDEIEWLKSKSESIPLEKWPIINIDGKSLVHLVDLSRFSQQRQEIRPIDVIVCVYNVENPRSVNINEWEKIFEEMRKEFPKTTRIVFGIGPEARNDREIKKELSKRRMKPIGIVEARKAARRVGSHAFGECLAKEIRKSIEGCFLIHESLKSEKQEQQQQPGEEIKRGGIGILQKPLEPDTEGGIVKVLVLGHQAVGKSAMIERMMSGKKELPKTKSTIGIERIEIKPGSGSGSIFTKKKKKKRKKYKMIAFDFAGQLEYMTIHEHFLSSFNSIYIVAIDGTTETTAIEQVEHWMGLLQNHANGPKQTSSMIVAVTKADKIEKQLGKEGIEARVTKIREQVKKWPIAREMGIEVEVIGVSNKTGIGIEEVKKAIERQGAKISEKKIPKEYREVTEVVERMREDKRRSGFIGIEELKEQVTRETRERITRAMGWEDVVEVLHNSGMTMANIEMGVICVRPEIVSTAMSLFISPPEHLSRLVSSSTGGGGVGGNGSRADILSEREVHKRIREGLNREGECEGLEESTVGFSNR